MPQRINILLENIGVNDLIKAFIYIGGAILAFISPLNNVLLFVGFVIVLDFITGYWASRKRGERFESRKAQRSWAKVILYPAGFIFSHWAKALAPEIPFVKGAIYLLIVIEGKSLEENFSEILGIELMKYIKIFIMRGRKGFIEEFNKEKNGDNTK